MWSNSALAFLLGIGLASAQQVAFQPLSSDLGDQDVVSAETQLSETIVSTLSSSTQHTTFLRLLQRSKCIPLLAHINTSTVFAPTDQAWIDWADKHRPKGEDVPSFGWLGSDGLGPWLATPSLENESDEFDNQNWALRQHLLYHMLNYTLPASAFVADSTTNITTETTLLFPLVEEPEHTPVPPPGPPWLPRGGEGLLAGHGQRIRLAKAGSEEGQERGMVGVDWTGKDGASVWDGSGWPTEGGNDTIAAQKKHTGKGGRKGAPSRSEPKVQGIRWVKNGAVVGVEGVLEPPPSIEEVIRSHPTLSYLSKLLPSDSPDPLPSNLSTSPHLTIFAPSNDALQSAFDDVEKRYLEGDYGAEGIGRIMAGGVVLGVGKREEVGWRDTWGEKGLEGESTLGNARKDAMLRPAADSASGEGLYVEAPSNGSLLVNGTEAEVVDIFASNGVIHIMPNLLVPDDFSLLNSAEKVLLSLNATRFVSLLRTANLSTAYAGEPGKDGKDEQAWTILAPSDEVLDMVDRWGGGRGVPPLPSHQLWQTFEQSQAQRHQLSDAAMKDVTPLQALLQYHILPGRLMPRDIKDGMLVGTELRTSSLKDGRQRMRIDVAERFIDGRTETISHGDIRFGGATALGSPTKIGKSAIYIVSNLISPPDDVLQVAVSNLQLSTFIAAVYAAELDHAFKKNPGITYFVPRNRAFGSLGLAMNYLLLAEGKDELRRLLKYHAVDRVIYTTESEGGKQVYTTLEGGEIVLKKTEGRNSTLFLQSPTRWEGYDSGEALPSNGELRPAMITHHDALTSTGTIQTIDSVVMPADLRMTIAKLIRGSRQTTMAELMDHAGLGWILEGREPSRDEVHQARLHGIVRPASDGDDEETPMPDIDSLAMPSYTVLCPSDKAFSRLNLTRYLDDRDELIKLLKLHIVPTQPSTPKTGSSQKIASPPSDGHPLALDDDLVYSTLLSAQSKYGEIAFRATGDNSFLVGIRNARAGIGHASARIGSSGRATVKWKRGTSTFDKKDGTSTEDDGQELWRGGMTLGGGVFMIDSVLLPYEPSWWSRWGWLVLTLVGVGIVVLIAIVSTGWWWITRDKREHYEPLEGEDNDS